MNKIRRKKLDKIQDKIIEIMEELEGIKDEEEEAYNNLPESLQESEKGEIMSEYINTMENAIDELDTVNEYINEILEG